MKKPSAVLCLDAGNTLLKWCMQADCSMPLATDAQVFSHPTASFKTPLQAQCGLLANLLGPFLSNTAQPPSAVLLSNVLGPVFEQAVRSICEQFQLPLHVLVPHSHSRLRSAYANPNLLGKDRWAACLALTQASNSPVNLLVSFGTATTLDAVVGMDTMNTDGWRHLGGYIVPGAKTMLDSLHVNTAELPAVELPEAGVEVVNGWPKATQQAISHGVAFMQVAMVKALLARLEAEFGQAPVAWLSGGLAAQFREYMPQAVLFENAVFKGLLLDYQLTRQSEA